MTKQKRLSNLCGSIYSRNGRWWWRVRLPGEKNIKAYPLRPVGSKYATKDRGVAEEVAKLMWEQAVFSSGQPSKRPHTVAELVQRYLQYAKDYYRPPSREPENIRYAVSPLINYCPMLPIEDFGPLKLKEIRKKMVEINWCRSVINKRVGIIKRMFRWAAMEQIIPIAVFQSLQTLEGLRFGRSGARETEPVRPVAERHANAILPYTTPTVAAMIQLQILTGMRSTELCIMRPCDIETTGKIWLYRPSTHKTAYRGYDRLVAIGPKAQDILKPLLSRKLTDYCFSPSESNNQRGQQATNAGDSYNRNSYRRAVEYAIRAARKAGLNVPDFCPHQLRHTAATKIRKEFGLDAARAVLGHRDMRITDDYAELDQALATQVALKCG